MIKESKCCSDVMEKHFNKKLVMIKENNENFENSTKCWFCDNDCINNEVKVRDHCHITLQYRGFAYRDCNINVKLNISSSRISQSQKSYDSHLIMQERSKFDLKINVIPNGLEK